MATAIHSHKIINSDSKLKTNTALQMRDTGVGFKTI